MSFCEDNDKTLGSDKQKKTHFFKKDGFNAWVGDVLCWNKKLNEFEIVHV
jgi:hypothetical protein